MGHHDDLCCPKKHHHKHHKKERCFKVTEIKCPKKKCCCEPCCNPCCMPMSPGLFGPGGVGFWVFLLILALLGIAWAQGGVVTPAG